MLKKAKKGSMPTPSRSKSNEHFIDQLRCVKITHWKVSRIKQKVLKNQSFDYHIDDRLNGYLSVSD